MKPENGTEETSAAPSQFDWRTAPIAEAQRRLGEVKRIYETAAQIVASRQEASPAVWHCWSQSHKKDGAVPAHVLAQCKDQIPDGRWVFRDDGAVGKNGDRISIVCCSQLCYTTYWRWNIERKMQRQTR